MACFLYRQALYCKRINFDNSVPPYKFPLTAYILPCRVCVTIPLNYCFSSYFYIMSQIKLGNSIAAM